MTFIIGTIDKIADIVGRDQEERGVPKGCCGYFSILSSLYSMTPGRGFEELLTKEKAWTP